VTRPNLFLATAILGFPIVAAFVAAAAPGLALLQPRAPLALMANHLVTLGWGTMAALGALYQLLPAVAGVRRDPVATVTIHWAAHTAGVAMVAIGFGTGRIGLLVAGGTAVAAGTMMLAASAASILRHHTRTLPVLWFAGAAIACLAAAAVWGTTLALNWRLVFWRTLLLPAGLAVHLGLGLLGWFGLLITGVSYFLLPRFSGTRDVPGLRPGLVFAGLAGAVVAVATGALLSPGLLRAGLVVGGAAGLVYAADLGRFLRAWQSPAWDITRAHWRIVLVETIVLGAGAIAGGLGVLPDATRWLIAGVGLFLLGWVTLAITGQAYKVTPFLMWYYRFRQGLTPYEIPRLEAPYWPRAGVPPFILLAGSGPLVALGVITGCPMLSAAGGWAFLAGACLFSFLLGYAWLPRLWAAGRRPPAPAEPG
jgi:hypothetical protein